MYELKRVHFGERVETHGLSLEGTPHYPCNNFYRMSADYLPGSFAGKFDVIVSSRCLEYVLLAHRALEGIAAALAPRGVAVVQWRSGRAIDVSQDLPDEVKRKLLNSLPEAPSPAFFSDIEECLSICADNSRFAEIARGKRDNLEPHMSSEEYRIANHLSLAWSDAVQRLRKDPSFDVTIEKWTMTYIGPLPGRVRVNRVR